MSFQPHASGLLVPDSRLARDALELAREIQPEFLLNHCLRSYLFAGAIGTARQENVDRELLYVATILHDIGLVLPGPLPDRFELVGADRAEQFLKEREVSAEKRAVVWDAIALHTSVAIALRKGPEVRLAALGIALDFAGGPQLRLVGRQQISAIVAQVPRLDFKSQMLTLLVDHVRRGPRTLAGTFLADVAHTHAADLQCPHVHEMITAAPFLE